MAVKEKKTIDPRAQAGACVKTPGGLRAFVVKLDPKDSDRVIIEYAVKGMGTDNYQFRSLTLIQESPEAEAKQIEGDIDKQCDCDGNPLEIDDHVKIVELKGRSRLLLNATATVVELNDSGAVRCRIKLDSTGTVLAWNPEWLQKLSEEIAPLVEQSPLDALATEITQYWAESENAEEIAKQAMYSALDSARLCGEALLEAKKNVVHGKWEEFRSTLIHPATGKSMPSSTATFYQRIAERWNEVREANIQSVNQARELLQKPRQQGLSNKERLDRHTEQTKHLFEDPSTVADLPESKPQQAALRKSEETVQIDSEHFDEAPNISEHLPEIDPSIYGDNVSEETARSLMSLGVMPCRPSITPEEFNAEMARSQVPKIRIINDRVTKRVMFTLNDEEKEGVVTAVLMDWGLMSVSAVLIEYDEGKQIQLSIEKVLFIAEKKS